MIFLKKEENLNTPYTGKLYKKNNNRTLREHSLQTKTTSKAHVHLPMSLPTSTTRLFSDAEYLWLLFDGCFYIYPAVEIAAWMRKSNMSQKNIDLPLLDEDITDRSKDKTDKTDRQPFPEIDCKVKIPLPTETIQVSNLLQDAHHYVLWDRSSTSLYTLEKEHVANNSAPRFVVMFRPSFPTTPLSLPIDPLDCSMSCAISESWVAYVDITRNMCIINRSSNKTYNVDCFSRVRCVLFWRDNQLLVIGHKNKAHTFDAALLAPLKVVHLSESGRYNDILLKLPDVGVLCHSQVGVSHMSFYPARYLDVVFSEPSKAVDMYTVNQCGFYLSTSLNKVRIVPVSDNPEKEDPEEENLELENSEEESNESGMSDYNLWELRNTHINHWQRENTMLTEKDESSWSVDYWVTNLRMNETGQCIITFY
jgi:hypothetical protein